MQKKLPKILTIAFLSVFILQLASLIFLLVLPEISYADDKIQKPTLQIPIGDFTSKNFTTISPKDGKLSIPWIGEYVQAIYKYAIGIMGILAAVVLMFGGVLWITAGGNNEKISSAKAWIGASLTGLVLALCSYMILAMVNPALVEFKPIEITTVSQADKKGCCEKPKAGGNCSIFIKKEACESGWKEGNYTCDTLGKCTDDVLAKNGPPGTTYKWLCLPMSVSCEDGTNPPTTTFDRSVCTKTLGSYIPCTDIKYPQSICCGQIP